MTRPKKSLPASGCLHNRNSYRPINDRRSIFSIIFRLFCSGGEKQNCTALARSGWAYSKACLSKFFAQKMKDLTCLCSINTKQNLSKKLDPILKPSRLKETTYRPHFHAQKSKSPRRFREVDPEILHACSTCPSRGLTRGWGVLFSFSFLAEKVGLRWSTFFEKS